MNVLKRVKLLYSSRLLVALPEFRSSSFHVLTEPGTVSCLKPVQLVTYGTDYSGKISEPDMWLVDMAP